MFTKRETTILAIVGGLALIVLAAVAVTMVMRGCGPAPAATPPPAVTPTPGGGAPTTAPPEGPDESWSRIQQAGRMVVGVAADYPPFEYYNADFELDGFDVALIKEMGQRLGVAVEFIDMAFEGLGGAVQLGQIDVAISALSVTPERREVVDFTYVYYVGQDAIVASPGAALSIDSIRDMAGRRVGAQRGSVYEEWLQTELVKAGLTPPENLFTYIKIDEALPDLQEGRVDLVVLDRLPAEVAEREGLVEIVGGSLNEQQYSIAVRHGAARLQGELNRALEALYNEGRLAALVEQYLDLDAPDQIPLPTPEPPTPTPEPGQPTSTPAPGCVDGMEFLQHLSYDDQNMAAPPVLQPGQNFVKSWRVRNIGTCPWDQSYALVYVDGNTPASGMSGRPVQVAAQVMPSAVYDLNANLVAPGSPGTYQGFWQMRNGQGVFFGPRLRVGIRVPAPPTQTPAPTQTPSPGISFTVDRTQIVRGECVTFRWDVVNVKAVYFYTDGQNWNQHGVPGRGESRQCPDQTRNYYLRVVKRDDNVETRQITIYVEQRVDAPRIALFQVNPSGPIQPGDCVAIQWDVQGNVSRVHITRNGGSLYDGAPLRGNMEDCPPGTGQMNYVIEATGPGGTGRASRTVTVSQPQPTPAPPTPTPVPPTPTPVPPTPTPVPPTATPLPPIMGRSYQVAQIGGQVVLPNTSLNANFEVNGTLRGSGGCNTYSATYQVSGDRLTISGLSATQTSCGTDVDQQEQAFFTALQSAATYQVSGGELRIRNSAGQVVLIMGELVATPS